MPTVILPDFQKELHDKSHLCLSLLLLFVLPTLNWGSVLKTSYVIIHSFSQILTRITKSFPDFLFCQYCTASLDLEAGLFMPVTAKMASQIKRKLSWQQERVKEILSW